jgi:hypothetical protein
VFGFASELAFSFRPESRSASPGFPNHELNGRDLRADIAFALTSTNLGAAIPEDVSGPLALMAEATRQAREPSVSAVAKLHLRHFLDVVTATPGRLHNEGSFASGAGFQRPKSVTARSRRDCSIPAVRTSAVCRSEDCKSADPIILSIRGGISLAGVNCHHAFPRHEPSQGFIGK